jgi:Tfp pilus assembly protein PilF
MINQRKKNMTEARRLFERSLNIFENTLGASHPGTDAILNNLGTLLQEGGDTTGALSLLQRALAIQEKTLSPDHPDIAVTLNNIALCLTKQGNLPEVKSSYSEPLRSRMPHSVKTIQIAARS